MTKQNTKQITAINRGGGGVKVVHIYCQCDDTLGILTTTTGCTHILPT